MNEALIEQVASAFRERDAHGRIRSAPAWHDLTAEERVEAYERSLQDRSLEAALDPAGLSTTARAVLTRITAGRP